MDGTAKGFKGGFFAWYTNYWMNNLNVIICCCLGVFTPRFPIIKYQSNMYALHEIHYRQDLKKTEMFTW